MFRNFGAPFAAGAIFTVLVAGTSAYAAAGSNFVLGRVNESPSTSTLSSSRGPALAMKAGGGPVFTVNNSQKVPKLNADAVDGLSASSFASASAKTGSIDSAGLELDLDEDGFVDAIGAYSECPAGSQLTGGGGADFTSSGYLMMSASDPDGYEGWLFVVGVDEDYIEDPSNVFSSAICWKSSGQQVGYKAVAERSLPARVVKLLKNQELVSRR